MPSLPRIRRTRSRELTVADVRPREPAELSAAGLTWIHLDAPSLEVAQSLAERFGWHPLDVEDVLSRRQRPEGRRLRRRGLPLRRSPLPGVRPRRSSA